MKIIECVQGSKEWLLARTGKITASRISDVLAKKETGKYQDYLTEKAIEILTGQPYESGYVSDAMARGSEQEPFARADYEISEGVIVDQVGFVVHPEIEQAGASPDGIVGDDGLLEIKNPKSSTHIQTLTTSKISNDYSNQIQWQLACTGRAWCHYISHDARLPENMRTVKILVLRDDKRIAELETAVKAFLVEVDDLVSKLKKI